jgi:murein tripeptide amidase MpaA
MALVMNTTEIASALAYFETSYPLLCQRVVLPEKTFEGRSCYALRIEKDRVRKKPAILIIGGVHAREWGGPDIVINFAGDVLRAYHTRKGLRYLGKTYSARDIKTIIEERRLFVFPCVNPDGVEFSHTRRHLWRKNRNPTYSKGDPRRIGVDINRNYDFLWDFKKFFHPAAWMSSLASDDPAIETYHGPAPFSEPETRNVRWLMDKSSSVLFLDLHSYDGDVLYTWGDDENQTTDPKQNFLNPAYNRKRGRIGDTYREYLTLDDYEIATGIAAAVSDAMRDVRNKHYKPLQAVGLYPTCGTSSDYAFSRHLVHPGLTKTFAFTLEFNFEGTAKDPFLATADPKTLDKTMLDVIPGLIALCLAVPKIRRRGFRSKNSTISRKA